MLSMLILTTLISLSAQAQEAVLTVSSANAEDTVFKSQVVEVEGQVSPLTCRLADMRLQYIEENFKKIEYIHKKISGNIERWRYRKYLEEIRLLEQKNQVNFDYLAKREITLEAEWDISELSQDVRDQIFFEKVDSQLRSEVLSMGSYGNLYYPNELAQVDVEKAMEGQLRIELYPSIQEYCYEDMGLSLHIRGAVSN